MSTNNAIFVVDSIFWFEQSNSTSTSNQTYMQWFKMTTLTSTQLSMIFSLSLIGSLFVLTSVHDQIPNSTTVFVYIVIITFGHLYSVSKGHSLIEILKLFWRIIKKKPMSQPLINAVFLLLAIIICLLLRIWEVNLALL